MVFTVMPYIVPYIVPPHSACGLPSGRAVQRVNVDFPVWMVESLDAEATRLGITRQPIIKTWIAERLDRRVS